jgi:hypothetical protein
MLDADLRVLSAETGRGGNASNSGYNDADHSLRVVYPATSTFERGLYGLLRGIYRCQLILPTQ